MESAITPVALLTMFLAANLPNRTWAQTLGRTAADDCGGALFRYDAVNMGSADKWWHDTD